MTTADVVAMWAKEGVQRSNRAVSRYCIKNQLDCFKDEGRNLLYVSRQSAEVWLEELKRIDQQTRTAGVTNKADTIEVEESLNIMDMEKELIEKALKKHKGKRKDAAADLGISERTLYRKLKEYDIEE
jgi:DNA-binding NtrC family response regulator